MFARKLLEWHNRNPRPLPWKETKDPYKIWLSEIILQQTQVSQGIPYYQRFVDTFPTVQDLASASEDEVLKLWQGLGYNSRARNLHQAAITVAEECNGYFPESRDDLLKLKGVGPYTAAAIASFAFGEVVPVIDTNVVRVVCRFLAIDQVPSRKDVRTRITDFLEGSIAGNDPAEFNQAIMNFGAIQCKPRNPECDSCPLQDGCRAYEYELTADIPVRPVKRPRKNRFFHYLVLHNDQGMIMKRREDSDIWQGLYDFPLIESNSEDALSDTILNGHLEEILVPDSSAAGIIRDSIHRERQLLTHQRIHCLFYPIFVEDLSLEGLRPDNVVFVKHGEESGYAVPKVVDCYFRVKSIFL